MKRITTILLSLSLFGLVGCDDLVKNFDFDEEGYGHLNWDILDYCESPAANAYDNYSDAMRMAGLDEVLAEGGYTCIIPNNEAFTSFIGAAGYSRLEEVPGPVLRDLLSYLIFPGDYRVSTMEVGEECTVNSLRGEPITIKRSTNAKSYTLTVNGVDGLAAITVESQDYLFKNNIVGQMVEEMPYYKPIVPATSTKPEGYVSTGEQLVIEAVEDTFLYQYGSGATKPQDKAKGYGLRIRNQSTYYGFGLLRFKLPETKIIENLAVAKLCMTVHKLGTYYTNNPDEEAFVTVHEINDELYNDWDEKTATYNNIVVERLNKKYLDVIKGGAVAKDTKWIGAGSFVPSMVSLPIEISATINSSILSHYENGVKDEEGNIIVDYVLFNKQTTSSSGSEIDVYDKDYYKSAPYIVLVGPALSKLQVGAVNPLVTTGYSTPFTDDHLAIQTPDEAANPEGFDYSPQNIIFVLSNEPTQGTLTLYGIPMQKNSTFTYYELCNGFVKYVRTEEGEDSFQLKVMDYLDGMVPEPVTITVQ